MKKSLLHLTFIFIALLSFAACGKAANDVLDSYVPPADTQTGEAQMQKRTLSISVLWALPPFRTALERFQAAYSDVEVVLHEYGDVMAASNYGDDTEKYTKQVTTQLMAGEADDIIEATAFDNIKMFDSGLLADLYPLMQSDPDFREEDYFMNVLAGLEYWGKLYQFPSQFFYQVAGVNNLFSDELVAAFQQYEVITYRQVLDIYNGLADKGGRYVGVAGTVQKFLAHIDFENKTCNFINDDFIKFITDQKNSAELLGGGALGTASGSNAIRAELEKDALKYLFKGADSTRFSYSVFFPYVEKEVFTHYIPIAHENGKLMLSTMDNYCVSEASQNKDLAWEFIKFLASPEANRDLRTFCFPIHRETYADRVAVELSESVENRRLLEAVDGETAQVVEQVMELFARYNEMPMESVFYDQVVIGMLVEAIENFYNGALTAEQVASELQNKVSLYLME